MGPRTVSGSKAKARPKTAASPPAPPPSEGGASTPPPGVVAERFAIDGVELVAFRWEAAPATASLTPAESAVLGELLGGASNAAIARARGVSARTVANQVAALLRKLGVGSRYELIARHGGGAR